MELMIGVPYRRTVEVLPGIRATFADAGHILGSSSVVLDCDEDGGTRRLVFSGGIGRSGLAIFRDPDPPDGAHAVIMESTYGNRDHESIGGARDQLSRVVRDTASRGGKILIPAFAVGRTQELLYDLHVLVRDGAIPHIPIFVDSPLATDTTAVFNMHPEPFDRSEKQVADIHDLFACNLVQFTCSVEESKAIDSHRGPMIVIAAFRHGGIGTNRPSSRTRGRRPPQFRVDRRFSG